MYTDANVMATLGGVRSLSEILERLHLQLAHWAQHGFGPWIARLASTNQFAGCGGLRHVEIEDSDEVEIGYALLPDFWRQGLATEIARVSVNVAFRDLGLSELVAFTLPTNGASRRVMEKAGFRYDRNMIYKGFPQVLYRQRRAEWSAESDVANSAASRWTTP
jgi:ribosomal-protein-alanine N-acetyltransferase